MSGFDYVFDTSAWVAFFAGAPAGRRAQDLLAATRVGTSVLTLAELSDLYHRGPLAALFQEAQAFVQTASEVLPVPSEAAARAGATKVARRERIPTFGLMDALILETARHHGARLLTTDADLRGLKGVEWLAR